MTFREHLEQAMKGRETIENQRRTARETRPVLLPLERERALWHLIREICADGPERIMGKNGRMNREANQENSETPIQL